MRLAIAIVLSSLLLPGQPACGEWVEILIHPNAARAVLLDPKIYQFLHVELPERQPLLLSRHLLLTDEAQLALPFDVELVPVGDKREREAFRFTGSDSGESGTLVVTFAFPPEGMSGRATLRLEKGQWRVVDEEVAEE